MIRVATIADIDAIMKIEGCSFIPQIQEVREVFEKRIEKCPGLFLVEEDGTGIYGYICAEFLSKVPESGVELALGHIPSETNDNSILYISSFALLPEKRGNGSGRRFWCEAEAFFRQSFSGIKCIFLVVNDLWKGAQKIYKDSGYESVQTFCKFFPTEEADIFSDGILMKKDL